MDQTQPASRLPNLLLADTELVNEIFARFGTLQFAVIRKRRCPAAKQLIGYMTPSASRGQRIHQSNDPHCVLQQPFFQIVPSLARNRTTFFSSLDVGRWTLDVGRSAFPPLELLPECAFLFPNVLLVER